MSRQPPPPGVSRSDTYRPGDYPSPNNRGSYQANYPPSSDYRDSNRYNYFDRHDDPRDCGPPMYEFGGNNRRRSPPPGPRSMRSPPRGFPSPRYDNREYSGGDRRGDRGDYYQGSQNSRPQYNPGPMEFSFRHDAPQPIATHSRTDSYAPRSNNLPYKGSHNRPRGGFRGRGGGTRLASDRAFLKGNRDPTPELMTGMIEREKQGAKYIPIEDVSDSSEAEMDMSEEDDDESAEPKKKHVKTTKKAPDGDNIPQWSNPDPYTALPPVEESRKKKDVVKLIRKARVEPAAGIKLDTAPVDDFISFGDDNDMEDEYIPTIQGAPTGPKVRTGPEMIDLTKPTIVDLLSDEDGDTRKYSAKHTLQLVNNPELGSRKRTIRDEIKDTPTLRQALSRTAPRPDFNIHKPTKGKRPASNGLITQDWHGADIPWANIDHSDTAKVGVWLHKEIVDFYHYVKPRRFEEFIRAKLVEDLRARVQNVYRRDQADILTFGSYPAGLYLPTADMDLVCVSRDYMNRGLKVIGQSRKALNKFAHFLEAERLPIPSTIEVISQARVPIVKYVDRLTGLKVDISFENNTGLAANKTFQDWKIKKPAMPMLVTLLKHFLAMRGLNEPMNGGIGGFSVICLVQSLLEMLPFVSRDESSEQMIPEHHLGEVLMEFLDLYGNKFNFITTAIQLNPPAYTSKAALGNLPYNKNKNQPGPKICIIDPNLSSNDISGGSSNTPTILKCFAQAYRLLQDRMSQLRSLEHRQGESILACVMEGNYSSFERQRQHLRQICQELYPEHEIED